MGIRGPVNERECGAKATVNERMSVGTGAPESKREHENTAPASK